MVSLSPCCPICGDASPPDAVFCISCGASLAQPATSTTRLLTPVQSHVSKPHLPLALAWRWRIKPVLIKSDVVAFGLALLVLLMRVASVGSHRPGLGAPGWLFVLAGGIHLVRGTRRGEPLTGMRHAVLCAAIPFAQVTQAFLTTTVLFGGAFMLLVVVQFLVALLPWHRCRP